MATTVGIVEYDVRLNLGQLKTDASKAEKIVKDSYSKMSKAPTGTGAKTQADAITKTTQEQVNATKKAAQESYNAISQYTPQIQRQFLAVERANNQVFNATTRSATAIQKYGVDSVQAQKATNSLNVAVQNQALQQNRLDQSLNSTNTTMKESKTAIMAVQGALIAFGAAIATNVNAGIRRLDTLNNFPRTMANFGLAAEDGEFAINAMAQELIGLPTSLDEAARAVQRFTAVNNDVKASTALFLGFNNALIAGGASMDIQKTALEQLSQAYSKGRVDMIEWRSLLTAMPAQLNQIAGSMGLTTDELGEGLRNSTISVDDFLLQISRLNTEGVGAFTSFKEQAMNQVGGVQVTITNLNTAIARSIEGMLSAIGTDELRTIIGGIATIFENFGKGVSGTVKVVKAIGPAGIVAGIGVGALTVAMIANRNATSLANAAMATFRGLLAVISKHPIIFALSAIVTGLTLVGGAMGAFGDETEDTVDYATELQKALEDYEKPLRGADDAASDLAETMAKIDDQITKANEDYRYQLAQLVADKNENIASLQATLAGEEKAYNNAYAERLASFTKTQNEEELTHKEKTKALQNQIDFLSKYNTQANKQQASELKFALAQEDAEYKKSTELRKNEFDTQTKAELTEYEKRRQENQNKLNEELALLEKHREDVLSVRGIILRDEIENLEHGRDEQLKSLEQQRKDAIQKGGEAGTGWGSEFTKNLATQLGTIDTTGAGAKAGRQFGSSWHEQFTKYIYENARSIYTIGDWIAEQLFKGTTDAISSKPKGNLSFIGAFMRSFNLSGGNLPNALIRLVTGNYADGGFTGRGDKYEPAGIVHKGEYVIPKEVVNQSTGMPDLSKISGGNTTVHVTLSLSGVMTSSKSDERAIATRMAKLINEAVTAKTGRVAIQGV
jgi:tape measure domain-containing protein